MVDEISSLTNINLDQVIENKMCETIIQTRIGGTAISFSRAACKIGFKNVYVIGKVGASPEKDNVPDIAGQLIIERLNRSGAIPLIALDNSRGTGHTIIIYLPNDKRLMLADSSANSSFSRQDITPDMEYRVAGTDIMFVSATCFLTGKRREAAIYLMSIAEKNNTMVIVDVVPHIIYKYFDFDTFKEVTRDADGLIIESNTAKRFIEKQDPLISASEADMLANEMLKDYHLILLKPDNDIQVLYDRNGLRKEEFTGYRDTAPEDRRGHSEGASISILYNYITTYTRSLPGNSG
jgi:sugar/nucleoside kinase (ribokinase family)